MGRGLGRPLLLLGLMEGVSVDATAASVGDVGDTGDSERDVGGTEGVLLLGEEISSVCRSDFCSCGYDVTWGSKEKC